MGQFNGLGMGLGTLSRLSAAQTRSISAENPTGEKGRGGMATEGTGAIPARELGQGWKVSPSIEIAGGETVTLADIEGPGAIQHIWLTVHPTALAQPRLAHLLGRRGDAVGRDPARRLLLQRLGRALQRHLAAGRGQSRPAGSTATGRCRSASRARITVENLSPDPIVGALLPDQLHADRGAGRLRLSPRPVAAQQPAALPGGAHAARRRARARGTTSAPTSPGASTTPAGGARARSSSTWTATTSGRRSAAPAPRTTSAAPGTSSIRPGSTEPTPPRSSGCRR